MSLIPGIGKVFASYGHVKVFRRFFFVSQYRKTFQGNTSVLCFRKFTVAKTLGIRGGVLGFCVGKFLSYSCEKFRR